MKYKKLTLAQVKAEIRKQGSFKGFMVGSKVNEHHFFSGWHLACDIQVDSIEELTKCGISWSYYNANTETGTYPSYYQYLSD